MNFEKLNENLEKAANVLLQQLEGTPSNKTACKTNRPYTFSRFYLFSNEELEYFFQHIDCTNKSILTVGSSGDQILYSLIGGAKEIVHLDINPLAKYYFDYKVAAIKNLNWKEFNYYLNNKKVQPLSQELYAKISHDITGESRLFWDELYVNDFGTKNADLHFHETSPRLYSKSTYYEMQEFLKVNKPKIKFICCDLQEIDKYLPKNKKFDYIFLSNIYQYSEKWKTNDLFTINNSLLPFKTILNTLSKQHLNENGQIQVHYAWEDVTSTLYLAARRLELKNNYYILKRPRQDNPGSLMYTPNLNEINNDDGYEMQ